jgi:hypothetical protein
VNPEGEDRRLQPHGPDRQLRCRERELAGLAQLVNPMLGDTQQLGSFGRADEVREVWHLGIDVAIFRVNNL